MQYQSMKDPVTGTPRTDCIIKIDGAAISFVPADPANSDWAAYQEWLAAGNAPLPPSN